MQMVEKTDNDKYYDHSLDCSDSDEVFVIVITGGRGNPNLNKKGDQVDTFHLKSKKGSGA